MYYSRKCNVKNQFEELMELLLTAVWGLVPNLSYELHSTEEPLKDTVVTIRTDFQQRMESVF